MADKTVNTKIQLRYDTLTNWTNIKTAGKGGLYVPKAGEMCVVQVNDSTTNDPSPILFKVGDGHTSFIDLKYGSALASDVYSWAKEKQLAVTTSGSGTFVTGITSDASGITVTLGTPPNDNTTNTVGNVQNTASTLYLVGSKTVNLDTTQDTSDRSYVNGSVYVKGRQLGIGDMTNGLVTIVDGTVAAQSMSTGTLTATTGIRQSADASTVKIPNESGTIITDADTKSAGTVTLDWGSTSKLATINGTDVNVTMPAAPSYSDTTYTFANGSSLGTFTVTPKGGSAQTVTVGGLKDAAGKDVDLTTMTNAGNLPSVAAVKAYVADQISGKSSIAYVIDSSVEGAYCNTAFNIAVTKTGEANSKVELTSGTVQTTDGKEIGLTDFKVGDIIYTKAADIKDWFYSGSAKSGDLIVHTFYQISGDTPVLDAYVQLSGVEGGRAEFVWEETSTIGTITVGNTTKPFQLTAPTNPTKYIKEYVGTGDMSDGAATNPYLSLYVSGGVMRSQHQIKGGDNTLVTSDASGNITIANTYSYTLPTASSSALGGIKTGYTSSGQNYKVNVDSNGNAYVNVPWKNDNTWRPVQVGGSSFLSDTTKALNLAAGTSSTISLTSSVDTTLGVGTVKLDVSAKVLTTDDVLILNGGSATTVI